MAFLPVLPDLDPKPPATRGESRQLAPGTTRRCGAPTRLGSGFSGVKVPAANDGVKEVSAPDSPFHAGQGADKTGAITT